MSRCWCSRPPAACVLVLLVAMHMQAHTAAAASPAASFQQPAQCVVNIEGAVQGGVRNASMECRGGPVSVLANRNLLGPFTRSFQGVHLLAGKRPECLLTLVGDTKATFVSSRLHGVRAHLVPGLRHVLCVADNSRLVLLNSSVSNNTGTGVAATDDTHVTLNGSTISNNSAAASGAGMLVSGRAVAIVTGGSSIDGNVARSRYGDGNNVDGSGGGVFVAEEATLEVTGGSSIAGNKAVDSGGAIFGNGSAVITITGNSSIANNRAGNASGVAVAGSARLLITGGSQIVGNAIYMGFSLENTEEAAERGLRDAPVMAYPNSSVSITGGAGFRGNGVNGQGLNDTMLQMVQQLGFGLFFARKDVFIQPGARLEMDESVFGDEGPLNVCSGSVARMFTPLMTTCPAGSFPDSTIFCKCCPASRYSFSANITVEYCHVCPEHATCPGANRALPDAGYWHSSPQSVQMHACPGGTNTCGKDGQCEPGYAGNLCGGCAPNHGSTLPFKCARCMSPGHQVGLYFLLAFATFLFMLLTVLSTHRDNVQAATIVRPSDVIKVLVHFLQFLVILGSISAPWPAMLRSVFTASSLVYGAGTGQALSPDCWLPLLNLTHPPLAVQRALLNFITPVVLFCCVATTVAGLCAVLRWLSRRRKANGRLLAVRSARFLRQLPIVAIVVMFFAFPTVVKTALSFFACLPIDDASQQPYPEYAVLNHTAGYSLMDINAECYVSWHRNWAFGLGLPAVLVLCVGVPAWLLVFLLRAGRSGKAADALFQEQFGFLFRNYRDKCVAWEAMWAVQTVLLTTVAVLQYSISAYYCIILLSVIFLASAVLEAVMQPYADRRLHHLSLASSACLFLTAQCTLVLFTASGSAMESVPAPVPVVIGVLLVVVNAGFVLACLGFIVACIVQPRRKQLAQLAAKVTPCLKA